MLQGRVWMVRPRWLLLASLILAAVPACNDSLSPPPLLPLPPPPPLPPALLPPQPPPVFTRLMIGATIVDSLPGTGTRLYSFVADSGREYAAFFEANLGSAAIAISDSATQELIASVFDAAGGAGLTSVVTGNFTHPGVLLGTVTGAGA